MITNIDRFKELIDNKTLNEIIQPFNEGLIHTYPPNFFIKRTYAFFNKSYGVGFLEEDPDILQFYLIISNKITAENILLYDYHLKTMGYYISAIQLNTDDFIAFNQFKDNYNEEQINCAELIIEAKFDIIKHLDTAYHVTHEDFLQKIMKNGLVPKALNKLSYHPDRVYVTNSLQSARNLVPQMVKLNNRFIHNTNGTITVHKNNNFVLLELSDLGGIRFFDDVNFSNDGFCTYKNITPYKIKILEKIKG